MPAASATFRSSLLLLPMLFAQYQRTVYSGKGEIQDVSSSHPLSYWTDDPIARDDGGDLSVGYKAPNGKVIGKQDYQSKVELHRIGTIDNREIVEVVYRIRSDVVELGSEFLWHILLVSTRPGQFAEIFHLQASGGPVTLALSRIVEVGHERILATYNPDGGNGGGCWEGYWWFDSAGPHPVSFDPVYKAIGERTPKDSTFAVGCWTIDLDQHQIHTNVQKINAECRACGQLGTATADFEVVHGVAKPTKVEFDSDPEN